MCRECLQAQLGDQGQERELPLASGDIGNIETHVLASLQVLNGLLGFKNLNKKALKAKVDDENEDVRSKI